MDKNSFLLYGGVIVIKVVVGIGGVGIVLVVIFLMGFMGYSFGVKWSLLIVMLLC